MKWRPGRRVYRTTVLTWLFVAVVVGLALARAGVVIGAVWWTLPLVAVIGLMALRPTRIACVIVLVAGLMLGVIQGNAFLRSVASYELYTDEKVEIEGVVKEDPTYGKTGNRQFTLEKIKIGYAGSSERQSLRGDLFITTPMSVDINRHDRVRVEGKFRNGFGPFQGSVSYATVTPLAHEQNPFDILRARFATGVVGALPEPHASLGLGFVIGMKTSLPDDMSLALQQLSLTHMVVASGYNLTVLVRAAKRLRARRSRLQTLLLSLMLIGMFLMITGFSPSMVRAGLVSGLSLIAWYYGRQMRPLVALTLVMAATAFVYPPYPWGDIGWWLSFAAFSGILLVVPLVVRTFWQDRSPPMLLQIAIEAFVAQILTLPIILLFFGNLSILGLIANVLIVPLIPFAMLSVAFVGFADFISPVLAAYVALPAHAILALIVWAIYSMSTVPWASVEVTIGLPALIAWYAILGVGVGLAWWRLSKEQRREALAYQIV